MIFFFLISSVVAGEAKPIGIDLRTLVERKLNPAPGALAISNDEIKEKIKKAVPNKDSQIHLFCQSGRRAGIAEKTLKEMGYKNVKNIKNWQNWNESQKK